MTVQQTLEEFRGSGRILIVCEFVRWKASQCVEYSCLLRVESPVFVKRDKSGQKRS
jgi:hypothetical protein